MEVIVIMKKSVSVVIILILVLSCVSITNAFNSKTFEVVKFEYLGFAQQTAKACKQDVCGELWYNRATGKDKKQRQNPPIGASTSVSGTRKSGQRI